MSTIPRVSDVFLSANATVDAFPIPDGDFILAGLDDVNGKGVALRITPETARALATWLLAATA